MQDHQQEIIRNPLQMHKQPPEAIDIPRQYNISTS